MIYKNSERMRDFLGLFYCSLSFLYFEGVFSKTIIPLALVGYEMIIADLVLSIMSFNAHSWNNC